ncbi:heparin lyase I family protein [Zobellia roscoffensis]|uniref:heparin lyase I family protein n=1 Tax=Zobellia roscoffensis TaxID=2779508 RepID=UPI00188B4CF3|nr:heparin lyase I family protein [Zobellia roscoffensis]
MKFLSLFLVVVAVSMSSDKNSAVFWFQDATEDSKLVLLQNRNLGHEINQYMSTDSICKTKGGKAFDTGLKVWCWDDISIPSYVGEKSKNFSDNQLKVDSECYEKQVSIEKGRLKFRVSPLNFKANDWCDNEFNIRAEISTAPWLVNHPKGTEEWFGWSYTLGDDYIVDQDNPWLFFQVHEGTKGKTPLIALWCMNKGGQGSGKAGEIHIVNSSSNYGNNFYPTNIVPTAGQTMDIVMHVVWGDTHNGLLEVWIDGVQVHNRQARTVRFSNPVGGNAKWGIYKWTWRNKDGVTKSQKQGITHLQTFMGPLKMVTRRPKDINYLSNSYMLVAP